MKHIRKVSVMHASAFDDFLNTVWVAWRDFRASKKNELLG